MVNRNGVLDRPCDPTQVTALLGGRQQVAAVATPSMADRDLMVLIQGDDVRAFAVFYDRHVKVATSVAMRVVRDREMAEDATQEGFVGFWRTRASYRADITAVKTWLLAIVCNRAIDLSRRKRARPAAFVDDEQLALQVAPDCTEDQAIAREGHRELRALFEKLPREQRQVIELAYINGLTHSEISERLKLPLGTTKGRIRLGNQKLRTAITWEHAPVS
jgi:RNA polymerase sigma-70 factor (ECF subfamily)